MFPHPQKNKHTYIYKIHASNDEYKFSIKKFHHFYLQQLINMKNLSQDERDPDSFLSIRERLRSVRSITR